MAPDLDDVVERPVQRQAVAGRLSARVAGDVHRPVREVPRPLGGGEDERRHPVDGQVAVEAADRIGDERRVEVVVEVERAIVPVGPRQSGAVLPGLDHHRAERLAGGTEALRVLVGGHADHRQRPEEALRHRPLRGPARRSLRRVVVAARRVVQGAVDEDVVGRTADQRIHGQRHRSRELAVALEPGGVARVDAELGGEPVGRHAGDAVDGRVVAGGGKQGAGGEAVDIGDVQTGVGDRLPGDLDGDGAQRPVEPLHDRALGVAHDRHLVACREATGHETSRAKAGTATPPSRSSNATETAAPTSSGASGPSSRRPIAGGRHAPSRRRRRGRRRRGRTGGRRRSPGGTTGGRRSTTG